MKWVMLIWLCCLTGLLAQTPLAWINEFHYDNAGTDTMEFVELVVHSSTPDVSLLTLTLYNGNNQSVYDSHTVDTFVPGDTTEGFIFYYKVFPTNGIQNGAPDGLCLDYNGIVLQFISYEGTFTAADGPAAGMTSVDIGVAEDSSTPVGSSLQLEGSGNHYSDFTWTGPLPHTMGSLNSNQTLLPVTGISGEKSLPLSQFQLYQNYPNPFNPSTEITFFLGQAGPVKLQVFDIRGGLVQTLVDKMLPPGNHSVTWDGGDVHGNFVTSGIFIYRLTTPAGELSRKMTLIR